LVGNEFGTPDRPVLIIASGERWPDGSLRPALEDALGAGAVLHHLAGAGRTLSTEATAIAAMFAATREVESALRSCGTAHRLVQAGYSGDVDVAAELECDDAVPLLNDGAFSSA
jgi:2-phosphosulfolactate phosphatase